MRYPLSRTLALRAGGICLVLVAQAGTHAAEFSPPDKATALEALQAFVAESAKAGDRVDLWLTVFGALQKASLIKADKKALTVKIQNNNFDQHWEKISPEEIVAIGKACAGKNAQRCLIVADYCFATEQNKRADDILQWIAEIDSSMVPKLASRWEYLKKAQPAPAPAASPMRIIASTSADARPINPPAKLAYRASEKGAVNPVKDVAAAIDNVIEIDLAEMGIRPEAVCDDAAFLRRVSLDLNGQIPSPEEVIEFYRSADTAKRVKKVDELLERAEYADHWATFWNVLLIGRRTRGDADVNPAVFRAWLREQFSKNQRYDKLVTDILTASGANDSNGPANYLTFHLNDTLPNTVAHLSQTFLGARIGCAQCHDHPFDKWTQQDFWGFSSFLANTRSERKELKDDPKDKDRVTKAWHVLLDQNDRNGGGRYDPPSSEFRLPPKALDGPVFSTPARAGNNDGNDGKPVKKLRDKRRNEKIENAAKDNKPGMMDDKNKMGMDKDKSMGMMGNTSASANGERGYLYREALANWITNTENEKFAQAAVNRMWRQMFGYGLVEPIDDIRPKNPPSHPEVMKILVDDFNASGRDLKRLLRIIANTKAYQRAAVGSATGVARHKAVRYAARAEVRPMTPEVLLAAVVKATGGDEKSKSLQEGLRETDRSIMAGTMKEVKPDVRDYYELMQRFVNSSTSEDRAGKLQFEGTVAQALMLMHSEFMNRAIRESIQRFKKKGMGDMIYIFAATLGRPPTATEAQTFSQFGDGLEGIMWVLLNSAEFVTIH
jgi:hypothetical protein